MKYIYGPVKSRRLGLSLGLSLIPHKTCDFDCVYCQLGQTPLKTKERKEYVNIEEIISELSVWFSQHRQEKIDYISLSGSGEPTLNIKIGEIIAGIKQITDIPVAVITNSSLLGDEEVRKSLLGADLIVPSLDAARQDIFNNIDRPIEGIRVEDIVNSLVLLRQEFKGKIWLEVMLVKGLNDDLRYIRRLKEEVDKIRPDKIQLNSPIRTTAEPGILPVANNKLEKIREILGENCEII